MEVYRICDWDEVFENNRSREMKNMRWVPIPNSFDGGRISELIERGGPDFYAAWCALVLVASRCTPRGTLIRRSGSALTPEALATRTNLPAACFESMLPVAKAIKLIEVISIPQAPAEIPHPPAGIPHPTAEEGRKEGTEGKEGREDSAPRSEKGRKSRADRLKAFMQALPESHRTDAMRGTLADWVAHRANLRKPLTPQTITRQANKLGALPLAEAIEALERSMTGGWTKIVTNKELYSRSGKSPNSSHRAERRAREFKESSDLPPATAH